MPYIAPVLTVDSVIFQLVDNELCVLLVRRSHAPFKGHLALPGGYNAQGETTSECMERILHTKAGVMPNDLRLIEQLYTFDTIARDPRGHAVSVTYMGLGKDIIPTENTRTESPGFYPVTALPDVAYDHADIIGYAHQRLAAKITYTNASYAMLDTYFTLTQLQIAYEAVFGKELDKRNFRKKFLSLDLVRATEEYRRDGAHRPARLYTFKQQKLQTLLRSFD